MKVSSIAVLGGLAALASADLVKEDYLHPVACTAETVTVTVTAGAGAGSGSGSGGYANQPPANATPQPSSSAGTPTTPPAAAKTHKVEVGAAGNLIFSPNQVNAAVGDVVEFNFLALNHSVTQSEFLTPCTFNGGFDTGLNQFNPKNESGLFLKSFTVTDTLPKWFYCKQGAPANHCGRGMVFGINPGNKMNEFIENAKKQNGNLSPTPAPTAPTGPTGTGAPPAKRTINVTVGLDKGKTLKFEPEFLQHVNRGDVVHFDFRALNHTLTESSFDDPCKKLAATAIDTNFQNANPQDIPNLRAFDLTLDTDANTPRWFYCKQANGQPNGHCANGMVFSINPKSPEQHQEFLQKAKATLPKVKGRSLQLGQMW